MPVSECFKSEMPDVPVHDFGPWADERALSGMETLEKRYSCSKGGCNYTTNRLANLNRHRRRHEETKSKESDGEWLFNVTIIINDISVIHVTANRCAGGLKKIWTYGRAPQRHRHFVGFFHVPVQAQTRDQAFYTVIQTHRPY